jgi:hypothetical protein
VSELTTEDLEGHVRAMARAETEEELVAAFAAYVRDSVEHETDPYDKIGRFFVSMLRSQLDAMGQMFARRTRGGVA